jgi:2-polyprenyl-3-methyl-5-hydroxy-6-metoxy-1,4-benzoquinol methylase
LAKGARVITMENKAFQDKNDIYYNSFKWEITPLIPEGPHAIMDLGCGTGVFGRKLREQNKAREVVGVEIFKEAADEAAKYYEKVYQGDVEQIRLEYEDYFDFVICGDIIEHLNDPWKMLGRIKTWLKIEGRVLVSIPNIRYWRVLRDLVFRGDWKYREAGILDKTHLRFFTMKSFLRAMTEAGFDIAYSGFLTYGARQNLFNRITFGLFEPFMGTLIIVLGKKVLPKEHRVGVPLVRPPFKSLPTLPTARG